MERPPSDISRGKAVQRPVSVACGDGLKLALPWATKRSDDNRGRYIKQRGTASICDASTPFCPSAAKRPRQARVGAFKYDALSYARNFDDGVLDDEERFSHGFTSRYAAPASKSSYSSSSSSSRG